MIEVTINETEEEKEVVKKYPYAGESDHGDVVLFTEPAHGVVLASQSWIAGFVSDTWDESFFTPIPSITITSRTE